MPTTDSIIYNGYLSIQNGQFFSSDNNLYKVSWRIITAGSHGESELGLHTDTYAHNI